jgi:Protein of unknown function (DUF3795)
MDKASIEAFKGLLKETQEALIAEGVDYSEMTAPCGLSCSACGFHLATRNEMLRSAIAEYVGMPKEMISCKGCRDEDGKCAHLAMPCRVYPCTEEKGIEFCHECSDFPCDYLHPYADRADMLPHNTKVFNLCLMRKMGLEAWAKDKAASVRDVYFWEDWTL